MIRHRATLRLVHNLRLLLQTRDDAIGGVLEVCESYRGHVITRRGERSFVAHVRDVRPGEAGRQRGETFTVVIHWSVQGNLGQMHAEYLFATLNIGTIDGDLTIESTGTQERPVENIRSVRTRQHDDALLGTETVHLNQKLIQRVFALIVASCEATATTLTTDGVDFVDENDGRLLLTRLGKQIANSRRADADKHLHEIRPRNGKKRDPSLARGGFREKRLSRPRRSDEKRAVGNFRAQGFVFLRTLQKVNKLHNLALRLVATGDVFEHNFILRVLVQSRHRRLTDVKDPTGAAAHAAAHASHTRASTSEIQPPPDQQERRQQPHQFRLQKYFIDVRHRHKIF